MTTEDKNDFAADPAHDTTEAPTHRRTVRSYVMRAGRTTAGQERALNELWPRYGIEYDGLPLDLDRSFGRHALRMIEIGFGTGDALLAFARAHPEMDCLGLEVHRPGVGHLLMDAEIAELTNLRVICYDAVEVLTHQLPKASIARAHIFFPDPWPKKRHHKRRLIQPQFAALLGQVLESGGVLRLATDWEDYAHHMREVLDAATAFENIAGAAGFVTRLADRPLTRFERRGQRLGHGVWDLEYHRK